MRILFILSGNRNDKLDPLIHNQGLSLEKYINAEIDYFTIKGKGIRGYLSNVMPLRKKLKENNYDLVHAHYSFSAFTASLAGGKPLVVSLMGSDVNSSTFYRLIIRVFAILFSWKTIIVKSKEMYNLLGFKKAVVIPNGVNINKYCPMNKDECRKQLGWSNITKHILFPANPDRKEKNFGLLKGTIVRLPDVEVHVFRNIENDETPLWYNAADAIVFTSLSEGSPNVIKEAMACNRPIASADVGDVRWLLGDVDGCYLFAYDIEDCEKKISEAISFSERQSTTGRERLYAIGLEDNQIANRINKVYNQVKNKECKMKND